MTGKIAPSMMCCDFFDLRTQLNVFEEKKIELLHIDIMDGSFVPNFALGTDFVKQLKKATDIPLDIHLMVEDPASAIETFAFGEGDYVSVHLETTRHPQRLLSAIRARGAKPMIALNPATPVSMIEELVNDIDALLIMTVNPGFAGQKMTPNSIEKIKKARQFLDERAKQNIEIEVDGNVSIENAIRMRAAGADIFVLGTSSLFVGDIRSNADKFRESVLGVR